MTQRYTLVLRDSARPEFAYAMLVFSIFICLWTFGAYITSSDLQEPIMIKTVGGYSVIDSNSWRLFLIPDIISWIITIYCFRFKLQSFTNVGVNQ